MMAVMLQQLLVVVALMMMVKVGTMEMTIIVEYLDTMHIEKRKEQLVNNY